MYTGLSNPDNTSSLDGVNMWNTISKDDPSQRTEILLNIVQSTEEVGLRVGHMKLLKNFRNASWFKPPELYDNQDSPIINAMVRSVW
jgi:hypothetical protein